MEAWSNLISHFLPWPTTFYDRLQRCIFWTYERSGGGAAVRAGTHAFKRASHWAHYHLRRLKAFYKHDGSVSVTKCAPSHTVGETEAWCPSGVTHSAPHTSNLIVYASTHTCKCCTRGASPLTHAAVGSVGGCKWRRAILPAWTIRRAQARRESERKQVGRIIFMGLGAKQRLIGEGQLQRRTAGVCASQRENNWISCRHFFILWH